jgi:hypothetical protein
VSGWEDGMPNDGSKVNPAGATRTSGSGGQAQPETRGHGAS